MIFLILVNLTPVKTDLLTNPKYLILGQIYRLSHTVSKFVTFFVYCSPIENHRFHAQKVTRFFIIFGDFIDLTPLQIHRFHSLCNIDIQEIDGNEAHFCPESGLKRPNADEFQSIL